MARVQPQQMTTPGVVGRWSVKDLVAHITWSEREMVGVLAARALVGSDLWSLTNDERNEIVYQQNRDRPLDEVLAEAKAVYARLLALVSGMSAAELNDPAQFARDARRLAALAGDCRQHLYPLPGARPEFAGLAGRTGSITTLRRQEVDFLAPPMLTCTIIRRDHIRTTGG